MLTAEDIREYALQIGYSRVGFAGTEDFSRHEEVLQERFADYDWWVELPLQPLALAKIRSSFPFAKTIIVFAYDYAQKSFPASLTEMLGRVYQARCYLSPPGNIHHARLELFRQYLAAHGVKNEPGGFMPARWAGVRAGVTDFGKNTLAYVDGIGSFILLETLLVDLELEPNKPSPESRCPRDCTLCLDACPSGALSEPYRLNPRRCLSFNCWMTNKNFGHGVTDDIPEDMRPLMGQRVHGCDYCQEACPRNRQKLKADLPPDDFLTAIAPSVNLRDMLHLPAGYYESRIQPLMYNYIREKRFFQRNAAVAMGNSGDESYIPDLVQELDNEHEIVRTHVAWALKRLRP